MAYKRRGVTFLFAVIAIAAILGTLTVALSSLVTYQNLRTNRLQAARAKLAADSGLQYVIAQLANTQTSTSNVSSSTGGDLKTATGQQDTWYSLGTSGTQEFQLGNLSFRVQVLDAASLIDVNTADNAQLTKLPLTQEQVDSLLDYIQAGQTSRAQGGKDDYYNGLTVPYNPTLRKLNSIDELLNVKGFTAQQLYAPTVQSPVDGSATVSQNVVLADLLETYTANREVNANGQNKQSIRQVTVAALTRMGFSNQTATAIFNLRQTATSMRQVISVQGMNARNAAQLLDTYTLDGAATHEGRLNVNTASLDALQSLPNISSDVASAIQSGQSNPISTFRALTSVNGVNLTALQNLADRVGFTSTTFLVRILGKSGDQTFAEQALIKTDGQAPVVARVTVPPFDNMDVRWNWDAVASKTDLSTQ